MSNATEPSPLMTARPEPLPGSSHRTGSLALAGAVLVPVLIHVACIERYGPFRDELYYLVCGRHLAWGYVDQPPLVAVVGGLTGFLGADSLAVVRAPNVLAGVATGLVTASIASRLGARPLAAAFAALATAWAPLYLFVFHHLNMNGFEVLLFALLTRQLLDAVPAPSRGAWMGVGVTVGVGLLNKYGIGFYAAAIGVGLALSPERRVLLTAGPWIAAAIALAVFSPHVAWQWQHGFPSLEFMRNAQTLKIRPTPPGEFLVAQVLLVHPANAALWVAGLGWLLGSRAACRQRWLGFAALALGTFFVSQRAKPYYLAPIYPALIAAGVVAWERWLGARRRLAAALVSAHVLAGAALAPTGVPILPVRTFTAYQSAIGLTPPQMERGKLGVLPQHYADMFGWAELVAEVQRVWRQLPPAERASASLLTQSYGEAAALEILGRGLPPVSSGHNAYFTWGPRFAEGDVILAVGPPDWQPELERNFRAVTVRGHNRCEYCLPSTHQLVVFVCRGWRRRLGALWPDLRRYI